MRTQYLTVGELAWELRRSRWYVYAMQRAGFRMPGGTATVAEAKAWLLANPRFVAKDAMRNPRGEPKIRRL